MVAPFEKFSKVIIDHSELIEKLLTATDKYYRQTDKELSEYCDPIFHDDAEIEKYCKLKKIPNNTD